MSISLSLSGKIALISGGSRGIGAATVRMFTAAGAKVVFSYRSARSQAEALAQECGSDVCYPVACDLDRPEAARSLVAEAGKNRMAHFLVLSVLLRWWGGRAVCFFPGGRFARGGGAPRLCRSILMA